MKVWGLDSPYSFIDEFEAVDVFALKPSQLADIHDAVVVDTSCLNMQQVIDIVTEKISQYAS